MKRYSIFLTGCVLCAIFAIAPPLSGSPCGEEYICAAGSPWYKANRIDFKISEESSKDFDSIKFELADNRDVLLTTSNNRKGEKNVGRILLVSGRVMLSKDMDLKRGYEIDALDGPSLMYQLVVSLLDQAFPEGPAGASGGKDVTVTGKKLGIKVATMSAGGLYGPPWNLNASLQKAGADHFNFNLLFSFGNSQERPRGVKLRLIGSWEKTAPSPHFPDDMSLEGWTPYSIGPFTQKTDRGTILDFGAQPWQAKSSALGDLRKAIAEEEKREKE